MPVGRRSGISATYIYTCFRPDVRLGNCIASFSRDGQKNLAASFNPAFLVECEAHLESDSGSTSLSGDGDNGYHANAIDRLWIALPIHTDDHRHISMVAVTQHMGDALDAAQPLSSATNRVQEERREHEFDMSIRSVKVCNSIASTTPTDDPTIVRTAAALLRLNTHS